MIELSSLTDVELDFLANETGIDRQRLTLLRQAADLAEQTQLPIEAHYGWLRLDFPPTLEALFASGPEPLRQGLERAIEENISPASLRRSLDQIMVQVSELQREQFPQPEATDVSHQVVGKLLNDTTGEPLSGLTVWGFDLDAHPARDLGYDITNRAGLFGLVYTTPLDQPTHEQGHRLRLQILDREGNAIHVAHVQAAVDQRQVLEIRVPIPAAPAVRSPTLSEVGAAAQLELPSPLLAALVEHNIHTLADIRRLGGLRRLQGLPVPVDHPVVQALEAHASLSLLSPDVQVINALVQQGYTSPATIAQALRTDFVPRMRDRLGDYQAAELQIIAQAQSKHLDNVLTGIRVEQANGLFDDSVINVFGEIPSVNCGCEDCEAAVSPLAYLADLINYTLRHVKRNVHLITLPFLHNTFHQPFGNLPAACAEMEKQVRQVRICIEVLRSYLQAQNLPTLPKQKATLAQEEKKYRLASYTTLLNKLGTSYEELRLARTAPAKVRNALAERLGIDLAPSRPDALDALFLDAQADPPAITETKLEALFGLVATNRDPLAEGPIPQMQTWRLAHLRTLWQAQDWPVDLYSTGELPKELQKFPRPPLIDPDLIGPDDFRFPFPKLNGDDPDQAFDLWLARRSWVDGRLTSLKQAREADGLTSILVQVFGDPLPDLDTLLTQLTEGTTREQEQAEQELQRLHLTRESLSRLLTLRDKDQGATSNSDEEPVQAAEWTEVYAILTQVQKLEQFSQWRAAEEQLQIQLGPELFWSSLRTPAEGDWPPTLSNQVPLIDPASVKLKELPEPTAGRQAIALWFTRRWRLDQISKALKQAHKQATVAQLDPFMVLLHQAIGDGDALPDGLELATLNSGLNSANPAEVAAAIAAIEQKLYLSVADFQRLLAIQTKAEPSAEEWAELYAILTAAQKAKREFPGWIAEEQSVGLHTNYWFARKASLPLWLASTEDRALWQQALRVRSQAPVIDPNLIGPGDIVDPSSSNPVYKLWSKRASWIKTGLSALKAEREAAPTLLAGFDTILVNRLMGPQAVASNAAELKTVREAHGLTYLVNGIWGSPPPDFAALLADLAGNDEVKEKAQWEITHTLSFTLEDFQQFMAIWSKDSAGAPITSAEWEAAETILAQAIQVKSIIGLGDEHSAGQEVEPRLAQFNLPLDAFSYLLRMRNLVASGADLLGSEWDEVYAILMQVQKRRMFGAWRLDEQAQDLTPPLLLAPDYFKLPEPPPLTFPPPEPTPLPPWLATWSDRQDWLDMLQARIDQEQALLEALQEAVSATEEITLPQLRDALVWVSNSHGTTLEARAKWFSDNLLIDAQVDGCQQTTRIAQAIETLQGLLFSLRTRILNDTYPDLELDADDFDQAWEWIGSYATWRAAMFVFLYPENILIPSLRRWQTPAFRTLVDSLRSRRRLSPAQAREAARTYADYYHDICTLKLETACQTRTRLHAPDGNATDYSYLFYTFARGGATNTIYWSAYDTKDNSGYAQSFWAAVPGLNDVINLIGAVPFEIAGEERYLYLFARVRDKGSQKLVFIRYDLAKRIWNEEPTELELPEKATTFTAVLKQSVREDSPPHLVIRLLHGALYHRRLNRDGSDWDDQEWGLLMGRAGGKRFRQLCAMVEFGVGDICLIVRTTGGALKYRLYGDHDDGSWQVVDDGEFRGAFCWPGTSQIYVFFGKGSTTSYRIINPGSLGPGMISRVHPELTTWLMDVAGADLGAIEVEEGPYANQTFLDLLTMDIYKDPNKYHWLALLPALKLAGLDDTKLREKFLYNYRKQAVRWIYAKAKDAEYTDEKFGAWKLANAYIYSFAPAPLDKPLTHLLFQASYGETTFLRARRTTNELSEPFPGIVGLQFITPVSGEVAESGARQFAFYLSNNQRGMYRALFGRKSSGELVEGAYRRVRLMPQVSGPFTIPEQLSESKLQYRREQVKTAYQANQGGPRLNLIYLEEAYYFGPIHLALQLQASGQYTAALDWFRSVYDYSMPQGERKIYYGLKAEESYDAVYERAQDWLLDPLNPHEIAATRRNTYTRFTILSIVRCLLEFADAEFTRDTAESVPRARLLYLTTLELLASSGLKQQFDLCADIIGNLDIELGDPYWNSTFFRLRREMAGITNAEQLTALATAVKTVLDNGEPPEVRFAKARDLIKAALAEIPPSQRLAEIVAEGSAASSRAQTSLLTIPAIAAAAEQVGVLAAQEFRQTVSLISGVTVDALTGEKIPLPWLGQPMQKGTTATPESAIAPSNLRQDYLQLTRANLLAPTHLEVLGQLTREAPLWGAKVIDKLSNPLVTAPLVTFCIPPNPVLDAMRLRAELNLYKLRTCRNIAGMERQLDPYAAPTDTTSGLPMIGAGGQLVLPGLAVLQPTPYRYSVLIERAKQLVGLAQQIEAALLSAIEKGDAERYSVLKARQDSRMARAGVRLQTLRVKEAEGGVKLAELQQERAQIQVDYYTKWLEQPISDLEVRSIGMLGIAASLQGQAAITSFVASGLPSGVTMNAQASASAISSGLSAMAGVFSTESSIYAALASYERRAQDWEFQKAVAQQDVRIGAQNVKIAEDHVRVVGQERVIAEMQADHAQEVVEFLANKFTNVELYDWMARVLEGVYSFFLQQATAVAQLATNQLAFERQEVPPPYIQADYWEAPSDGFTPGADGKAPDRRGLTGSARLLQDIYQLDQYAFDTNKRKLQLTKTLSLATLAPAEFQRFRETGVMVFATPMAWFDRDFPGHYLRLIHKVRTSVIALIPPNQGIRATLSTTGTSRVVIGGDIFQTVVRNAGPESVALTSPINATGLFELEQQSELLRPFEGLGVDTIWEFRMPKAANLFDYRTIADVLITIEYTALHSFDYYQQVIQTLKPTLSADRAFSFRHQFTEQWYDLHNSEQTSTPMTVSFQTMREDFPPNLENLKIQHVTLYFARTSGQTFEVPVLKLQFTETGASSPVGSGATSLDGMISTRSGNAGSWMAMLTKAPLGTWELVLPNTVEMKNRFKKGEIEDILFIITYAGRTPEWPV
jgi:hypothetical protein